MPESTQLPLWNIKDTAPIAEVAREAGISVAALFQAGQRGELTLHKLGRQWLCHRSEALAFARRRQEVRTSPGA